MRRLKRVRVNGLLDRFDHDVQIEESWEFVILHGPNGVGKTRLLEIIEAALKAQSVRLLRLPFKEVSFEFDDGTEYSVYRSGVPQLDLENVDEARLTDLHVGFKIATPSQQPIGWTVRSDEVLQTDRVLAAQVERMLPVERVGAAEYFDARVGDTITTAELLERYRNELSNFARTDTGFPTEAQPFFESQSVHLIETQRLLRFGEGSPTFRTQTGPRPRAHRSSTVVEFSSDLTRRIREALASNSRTSQQLDKIFPRRVLTEEVPDVTDEDIRSLYAGQSVLRQQLAEIAVLETSTEMPLPARALEGWERRVLWISLRDSERKLATFQNLLDKVQLLKEVVNARFLYKEIRIDGERGFSFVTDRGLEIPPSALSSGEQHEVVLLYDLLFNVRPNSLVLLDEPEISLHIAWQQEVLNDIRRIAELADLQFIVATHSPYIVHNWWDRAIALYGDEMRRDA